MSKVFELLGKYYSKVKQFFKFVYNSFIKWVIKPVWKYLKPVLFIVFYPINFLLNQLAKLPSFVIAILSGLIWGFGQLINRQYIKALIFFLIFSLVIFVEFATGSYNEEFNLYNDKIPGNEIEEELSNYLPTWYYYNLKEINPTSEFAYEDFTLLHDVAESNGYTFDESTLTFYDQLGQVIEVDNISYSTSDMFVFIGTQLRTIEEEVISASAGNVDNIELIIVDDVTRAKVLDLLRVQAEKNVLEDENYEALLSDQVVLTAIEELVEDGHIVDEASWDTTLTAYITDNNAALEVSALEELIDQKHVQLISDIDGLEDVAAILAKKSVLNIVEGLLDEQAERDIRVSGDFDELVAERVSEIATAILVGLGHLVDEVDWDNTLSIYIADHAEALVLQGETQLVNEKYIEIYDIQFESINATQTKVYYTSYYNSHFNKLFGALILQFDSVSSFKDMMQARLGQLTNMDNDDYNKMLARIYFEYNPELYSTIVDGVNNVYYERTGFFVKGAWGLATMGSISQTTLYQHKGIAFLLPNSGTQTIEARSIEIEGHHSTQLLLRGIISMLVVVYILFVFIWNIKDAYRTSKTIKETKVSPNERQYFAALYENFFEYIVLTPALILITFISVMPIFFGLAVAFTNYNIEHLPPGQLISWVGFQNFVEVFSVSSGGSIDFGGQFWKVFSWTLIWAFAATFTCFFGGFVQAVILNNTRVVFRKAWRAILILPWAMPALISQMIFRVMFNDNGYVNQVLFRTGITNLFTDWGMLGRGFNEAGTGLQRLLYFGDQNFQWLSNEANPWFVRIFIIVLNVWLGFPFFMALMSGVMTSIDKSLYEAASIDGATGFQQFRFITMPLVLFATSPLLVMTFSGNFNNFGVIYFITGGGPGGGTFETAYAGSTDILISWIYKLTVDANIRWYSMASVFSILIFLIIGTLSAWNFTRTRAFKEDD